MHLPQSQWSQLPTGELALFRLTSPLMRFPPLAVIRGSPWSARIACFGKETHTHRGRNSFVPRADTRNLNRRGSTLWRPLVSVDLRTDEMSSTGGHRFFAPFFTENEHTGSFSGRFEPRAPRASGLQVAFTFSKCHTVVPLPSLPSTMLGMTTRMVVSFRLEQTQ